MAYSEKVMEHFANPRNVGEMENPDGVGEVGNPKCGDIMRTVSYTHLDVYKRQALCVHALCSEARS